MTYGAIDPTTATAAPTPERIARHIAEGRRLRAEAANGAVLALVRAVLRALKWSVGRAAAASTAAAPAGREAATA